MRIIMGTTKTNSKRNRLPSLALGILVFGFVLAVITHASMAFGISDRGAFIILVIGGMASCGTAMQIDRYGWKNPFNLLGGLIGAAALVLSILTLANIRLSFLPNDRAAFTTLSLLMAAKVVLDVLRGLAAKLIRGDRQISVY
jgi:hypothetical protein